MVVFRSRAASIFAAALVLAGLLLAPTAHAEKKYHISGNFQAAPSIGGYWVFHEDVDAYAAYGVTFDYYFNEFWSLELEAMALEFFMDPGFTSAQKNFFRNFETIPSSTALLLSPGTSDVQTAQRAFVTDYINAINSSAMPIPERYEQVSGFGFTVGPRFNFFPTEMGGLFLAVGLGAAGTDNDVPYSGNRGFFSFKTEIGQDLRITDHFSFLIRMGFRHLGGFDAKRLDGVGGSFGIGYTF
ncbi:MAG: outer membrane beta-barrel protein [Oceanidesulfovibrio sp.]